MVSYDPREWLRVTRIAQLRKHCVHKTTRAKLHIVVYELALAVIMSIAAVPLSAMKGLDASYLFANNHRRPLRADPDLMKSIRLNIYPFAWPMSDTLLALLRQPDLHRSFEKQVRCQLIVCVRLVICVPAETCYHGPFFIRHANLVSAPDYSMLS